MRELKIKDIKLLKIIDYLKLSRFIQKDPSEISYLIDEFEKQRKNDKRNEKSNIILRSILFSELHMSANYSLIKFQLNRLVKYNTEPGNEYNNKLLLSRFYCSYEQSYNQMTWSAIGLFRVGNLIFTIEYIISYRKEIIFRYEIQVNEALLLEIDSIYAGVSTKFYIQYHFPWNKDFISWQGDMFSHQIDRYRLYEKYKNIIIYHVWANLLSSQISMGYLLAFTTEKKIEKKVIDAFFRQQGFDSDMIFNNYDYYLACNSFSHTNQISLINKVVDHSDPNVDRISNFLFYIQLNDIALREWNKEIALLNTKISKYNFYSLFNLINIFRYLIKLNKLKLQVENFMEGFEFKKFIRSENDVYYSKFINTKSTNMIDSIDDNLNKRFNFTLKVIKSMRKNLNAWSNIFSTILNIVIQIIIVIITAKTIINWLD